MVIGTCKFSKASIFLTSFQPSFLIEFMCSTELCAEVIMVLTSRVRLKTKYLSRNIRSMCWNMCKIQIPFARSRDLEEAPTFRPAHVGLIQEQKWSQPQGNKSVAKKTRSLCVPSKISLLQLPCMRLCKTVLNTFHLRLSSH